MHHRRLRSERRHPHTPSRRRQRRSQSRLLHRASMGRRTRAKAHRRSPRSPTHNRSHAGRTRTCATDTTAGASGCHRASPPNRLSCCLPYHPRGVLRQKRAGGALLHAVGTEPHAAPSAAILAPARTPARQTERGGRAWGEGMSIPSCFLIVTHVLTTPTLRVLRSLRSLRPGPRSSKAGRESRRP